MQILIDSEFQALIPPLSAEEKQQLEANIVADGCRDPLVVWALPTYTVDYSEAQDGSDPETYVYADAQLKRDFDEDHGHSEWREWFDDDGDYVHEEDWPCLLIDGHNRYEICTRLGLPFDTVAKEFDDRGHVTEWIIKNQFGRRNLIAYVRTQLALRLESVFEDRAKANQIRKPVNSVPKNSWEQNVAESLKQEIEAIKKQGLPRDVAIDLIDLAEANAGKEIRRKNMRESKGVYIAKSGKSIKIGIASDPETRIDQLKVGNPDIYLVEFFEYGDKSQKIESLAHAKFKEHRIHGEWFCEEIEDRARNYMAREYARLSETSSQVAAIAGVSTDTIAKVKKIEAVATPEVKAALASDEVSINQVYTQIKKVEKQQAREAAFAVQTQTAKTQPTLDQADAIEWLSRQEPCDLLLTDPPYSTDVADIESFAKSWLPLALSKVKPTGRAFIFVGAYPAELAAYLATAMPEQVLVWTYRNTLGPTPSHNYKLNWQAILYFKGVDAPALDCPVMLEQFSVQDINAPDGRQGDRYHAWQKPLDIADRFIRHSTKPGDTVLDPFACTGTFLIAAAGLGRTAKGCDISAENMAIAEGRGCLTSKAI